MRVESLIVNSKQVSVGIGPQGCGFRAQLLPEWPGLSRETLPLQPNYLLILLFTYSAALSSASLSLVASLPPA